MKNTSDIICKITKNKNQLYVNWEDWDRICSKYSLLMQLGMSWKTAKPQLWKDLFAAKPDYYDNLDPYHYYDARVEFARIQDMKDWMCVTDEHAQKILMEVIKETTK